jgi:hypothetical protein
MASNGRTGGDPFITKAISRNAKTTTLLSIALAMRSTATSSLCCSKAIGTAIITTIGAQRGSSVRRYRRILHAKPRANQRIWGYSQLGKRDKFNRADYRTFTINKSFDRLLPPSICRDCKRSSISCERRLKKNRNPWADRSGNGKGRRRKDFNPPRYRCRLSPTVQGTTRHRAGTQARQASRAQDGGAVNGSLTIIPPGLVGAIADFIYEAAPRPVREIALVGAIGFVAGIVGRAFNVSGTGLNLYTLVSRADWHRQRSDQPGISKLVSAVRPNCPTIAEFVGPAEIRSDAALLKWIAKHPCFLPLRASSACASNKCARRMRPSAKSA